MEQVVLGVKGENVEGLEPRVKLEEEETNTSREAFKEASRKEAPSGSKPSPPTLPLLNTIMASRFVSSSDTDSTPLLKEGLNINIKVG